MAVRGAEGGSRVLSAVLTLSRALALSVGLKMPLAWWLRRAWERSAAGIPSSMVF